LNRDKKGGFMFQNTLPLRYLFRRERNPKRFWKSRPFSLWNANICTKSSEKKWRKKGTNEGKMWVETAVDAAYFVLESKGSVAVANSAAYCILLPETREKCSDV